MVTRIAILCLEGEDKDKPPSTTSLTVPCCNIAVCVHQSSYQPAWVDTTLQLVSSCRILDPSLHVS